MSPKDVDPSTLKLNERTLSKIPKKALAEHLTALQEMYEMRGRKYEKAKSIIHANKTANKTATKANNINDDLIPRPGGRPSRDFNLFAAMQVKGKVELTEGTYGSLRSSVHEAIGKSNIDTMLPFRDQEQTEVVLVIASEQYPFLKKYHNSWPITILMRQFLNNHHYHANSKAKIATTLAATANAGSRTAGPSTAALGLAGGGSNGDDDDDEIQSDVSISDAGDD